MPLRTPPEPLDVDAVNVVTVGTVLWTVAGLGLAVFGRDWLAAHGHTHWIWVCVTGAGLGALGVWYCRRRRAALGRVGAARGD